MKILIKTTANGELEVRYDKLKSLDDAVSMLCGALDATVRQVLPSLETEELSKLYDDLAEVLDHLLTTLFPEFNELNEFDMTDAAIVYAQDQIINDAHKKGITLQEALQRYENKAQEYIAKRRAKVS